MIKASEWRFVTDKDNSLMTAFFVSLRKNHIICMVDRAKSLKQCNQEFKDGRADLLRWGNAMMHDTRSIWQLAYLYLIDEFNRKQFHEGEKRTPAQRLRITNKIYNVNDILYLR
jgi:hypothetical protein